MKSKQKKQIYKIISRLLLSQLIGTFFIYALIKSAKLFGAVYNITDGEYFITWALLSILALLSINHFCKE